MLTLGETERLIDGDKEGERDGERDGEMLTEGEVENETEGERESENEGLALGEREGENEPAEGIYSTIAAKVKHHKSGVLSASALATPICILSIEFTPVGVQATPVVGST
jgi:hypothetical protein